MPQFKPFYVIFTLLSCWPDGVSGEMIENLLEQGRYVFNAAGCISCHTVDQTLAGGRPIVTPLGTFYGPNITPHKEQGTGSWTEEDFLRALSEGISPSVEHYYPAFPYPSYTGMTKQDKLALWAYLKSQPAIARQSRSHNLIWLISSRVLLGSWKEGRFIPGEFSGDPAKSVEWNRGAYIATALGHCGECHTPRSILGGPINSRYLAGTRKGPEGAKIPNITPDGHTGIGNWSQEDLSVFLAAGRRPDGLYTGGLMAEILAQSIMPLTKEDRRALAIFLRSVTPVYHDVGSIPDLFWESDDFE